MKADLATFRRFVGQRLRTTSNAFEIPAKAFHAFAPSGRIKSQTLQDRSRIIRDAATFAVATDLPAGPIQEL
jgi:hypothetical protein